MPYYQTTIFSGDVCEVEIYFSPRAAGKTIPRGANQNLTPKQQEENNLRRARKNLARLINCNFGQGDIFLTLTYANDCAEDDSKKNLAKYLRRLRGYCRKNELPDLKYISVTENKSKRLHHHLLLPALPMETVMEAWDWGRVIISKLTPEGDYTGLANYITKESIDRQGNLSGKRWSSSRNLEKPIVKRKEVKRADKMVKPPKGYKVVQQYYYASDVTGLAQYMKAIRIGGADYSAGSEGRET